MPREARKVNFGVLVWAYDQISGHVPAPPDDRGLTCDERGCSICNGSGDDFGDALEWERLVYNGELRGPDRQEIEDAFGEILAREDFA